MRSGLVHEKRSFVGSPRKLNTGNEPAGVLGFADLPRFHPSPTRKQRCEERRTIVRCPNLYPCPRTDASWQLELEWRSPAVIDLDIRLSILPVAPRPSNLALSRSMDENRLFGGFDLAMVEDSDDRDS